MSVGKKYVKIILPGILLAATGIGANDFFGATWAGTAVGTGIFWAIMLGALLKYLLTVGMVKWQLYSGQTLLETWLVVFPKPVRWLFISYFLIWAILVSAALMGACNMAIAQFDVPKLHSNPKYSNAIYAALHGIAGWLLVRFVRFEWFEKVISFIVGFMFLAIVTCCFRVEPVSPAIEAPIFPLDKPVVILAIISGIGGTVTLLSFSYWIKEKNWDTLKYLKDAKISLAAGYIISGVFGMSILYIASHVLRPHGITAESEESAKLAFKKIGALMGESTGKYFFISGFYAAVVGSMLGVWQSVPYFFADGYYMLRKQNTEQNASYTHTPAYRYFQMFMILFAMIFLVQKAQILLVLYSLFGSLFIPIVAVSLLILNTKKELGRYKNHWLLNVFFVFVILLYACIIVIEMQ